MASKAGMFYLYIRRKNATRPFLYNNLRGKHKRVPSGFELRSSLINSCKSPLKINSHRQRAKESYVPDYLSKINS